jgi:hypothetical protein
MNVFQKEREEKKRKEKKEEGPISYIPIIPSDSNMIVTNVNLRAVECQSRLIQVIAVCNPL